MSSDLPSMQQDWHPDHNMPAPEYHGTVNSGNKSDRSEKNQERYGDAGADLPRYKEDNNFAYKMSRDK